MKKAKFIIIVCTFLMIAISSCNKDQKSNGTLPYYEFTESDKSKLVIGYSEGKELVYKNQNGEKIKLTIVSYKEGKASSVSGTFWGNEVVTNYYYDSQDILMQSADTSFPYEIHLKRYPSNSNYNVSPPVIGTSQFVGYLEVPGWNVYSDTLTKSKTINLNFNSQLAHIKINGKAYEKVIVIESGNSQSLEPQSPFNEPFHNVNKIYYDENNGIKEFDDLQNSKWQLQ